MCLKLVLKGVIYFMNTKRPDIAYAIIFLSMFMSNRNKPHWTTLRWILGCQVGTIKN